MVEKSGKSKITPEILHKIKQVTLFTRRLVNNMLLGSSKSSIRGMGFDFESLREYAIGDDVRFIDWRASGRSNVMLVRNFRQDQVKTVMIVVDISRSTEFGTLRQKKEIISRLAAIIAFIGHFSQDFVGLILFSETVELYLPPKRDRNYINVIMEALFSWEAKGKKTVSESVYQYLVKGMVKKALIFWFSDGIDEGFNAVIRRVALTHELYIMRHIDRLEKEFDSKVLLLVEDIEKEERMYFNMHARHSAILQKRLSAQEEIIKRAGGKFMDVTDVESTIKKIVTFFQSRMRA